MYKRQGGFPNTIIQKCSEVTRIEPMETLLSEYPDVLSDELSPEPMKTNTPMHIHIKGGATPRKVTTARRVPLRYESEAEKTVQELIQKGVIVPANETTDWCSPAFFVPQGRQDQRHVGHRLHGAERTHLIHPFSSTKEILQAVPKFSQN